MKTLVYGAGPLGSLLAAKLHEAGVDVALLARGQRLADLHEHGVLLEYAYSGARECHHVPLVEALGEDDAYDLVIIVMRKDQCVDILPALAKNQHARTVLFLQNNAAGFDDYAAALGPERVMVGFPVAGGERRDPVMRVMPLEAVPMPVGEIDGRRTDRARAVAALLARTGKRVQVRSDMDAWLVTHIPVVGAFFGLFAADLDPQRYARTRDARLLGVRARAEALRAQRAAGLPIRPRWFTSLLLLPEPLGVAMLRPMAGTEAFEIGVAGHSRAARDELIHLLAEYRRRLGPAAGAAPTLDRLAEHVAGTVPPLPDGSREMRLRWGGLAGLAAVLTALLAVRLLRRRLRGG